MDAKTKEREFSFETPCESSRTTKTTRSTVSIKIKGKSRKGFEAKKKRKGEFYLRYANTNHSSPLPSTTAVKTPKQRHHRRPPPRTTATPTNHLSPPRTEPPLTTNPIAALPSPPQIPSIITVSSPKQHRKRNPHHRQSKPWLHRNEPSPPEHHTSSDLRSDLSLSTISATKLPSLSPELAWLSTLSGVGRRRNEN